MMGLRSFFEKFYEKTIAWDYKIFLIILPVFYFMWSWLQLGLFHSWNEAYYMLRTSGELVIFDNPPFFIYTLKFFAIIFGENLFVFRFFIILCTLAIIIITYLIGKEITSKKIAVLAALMTGFFPAYVVFSKILQIEMFAILFGMLALYFIFKDKWVFSAIFIGLAIFAKIPMFVFLFPMIYYIYKTKPKIYVIWYLFISALINIPWYLYTFLNNPEFLANRHGSSSNFFALGMGHNITYLIFMYLLIFVMVAAVIILYIKIKPKNVKEYTLYFIILLTTLFYAFLPNHEYYLLPLFPALFLLISARLREVNLKKILGILLIASAILIIINPIYNVNYEEPCTYVKENYQGVQLYATYPPVAEYYTGFKNIKQVKNLGECESGSVLITTFGESSIVKCNITLIKSFDNNIFIYEVV